MTKQSQAQDPADYIKPLEINGLSGRMMHLPAPKKHASREMLVVYGHHSTLERWWGVMQVFNRYGAVTMPDLPGFGGMDSLYTIGQEPSLDNMADYLASFVKWRYKRRRVVLVGMSYGFLVVTRMLQRYPELCERVDFLVSVVGFAHYQDFLFSRNRMRAYRLVARTVALPPVAWLFRYTALQPSVLRQGYHRTFNAKKKFESVSSEEFDRVMDMEIALWHANDVRTHWRTTRSMLTVDNCRAQVDLPVWHVYAPHDQYFDVHTVEQHLKIIYSDVHMAKSGGTRHTPSVIATADESAMFMPPALRRALSSKKV